MPTIFSAGVNNCMQYPFLQNNQLVIVDALPGSGADLLIRLWSELDARLAYDSNALMSATGTTADPASREIDFNNVVPIRFVNWFLDHAGMSAAELAALLEFIATTAVVQREKTTGQLFNQTDSYVLQNQRAIFGINSRDRNMPWQAIRDLGCNVTVIKLVPATDQGLALQRKRYDICFPPGNAVARSNIVTSFNAPDPAVTAFDLATLLVNRSSDQIIGWISTQLGSDLRSDKVARAQSLLSTYCTEIMDNIDLGV